MQNRISRLLRAVTAAALLCVAGTTNAALITSIDLGRTLFLPDHDLVLESFRARYPGAGGPVLFERPNPSPGDMVSLTSGPVFNAAVAELTDADGDFLFLFGVHSGGTQTASSGFNDLADLPILVGNTISEIKWTLNTLTYENILLASQFPRTRVVYTSTLSFFGPDSSGTPAPAPATLLLLALGVIAAAALRPRRSG